MKHPTALFFDLDETLLDDERCWRIAVSLACRELRSRHPSIDSGALEQAYLENSARIWTAFGSVPRTRSGSSSARDLRLMVWSYVLDGFGASVAGLAEDAVDTYERHRRGNYVCFPEVLPVLQRLRGRLPIAVITNGPGDGQREKLDLTGLMPLFDFIVASADIGVSKPDAAIFQFALDKLGVAPEHVWHVGDNLHVDVAGARNAGLTAVWLNRNGAARSPEHPEPHVEIRSLTELLEYIEP